MRKPETMHYSKRVIGGVILFMLVVLSVAGFFSWKQYERHTRIQKEVAVLEAERERVKKENQSLKERIEYLVTDEFKEQESKERLNMRKNNEFVVEIESRSVANSSEGEKTKSDAVPFSEEPNYKKWWSKIFE